MLECFCSDSGYLLRGILWRTLFAWSDRPQFFRWWYSRCNSCFWSTWRGDCIRLSREISFVAVGRFEPSLTHFFDGLWSVLCRVCVVSQWRGISCLKLFCHFCLRKSHGEEASRHANSSFMGRWRINLLRSKDIQFLCWIRAEFWQDIRFSLSHALYVAPFFCLFLVLLGFILSFRSLSSSVCSIISFIWWVFVWLLSVLIVNVVLIGFPVIILLRCLYFLGAFDVVLAWSSPVAVLLYTFVAVSYARFSLATFCKNKMRTNDLWDAVSPVSLLSPRCLSCYLWTWLSYSTTLWSVRVKHFLSFMASLFSCTFWHVSCLLVVCFPLAVFWFAFPCVSLGEAHSTEQLDFCARTRVHILLPSLVCSKLHPLF